MTERRRYSLLAFSLLLSLSAANIQAEELTLRSLGAKGDGKTDDRAAIETALAKAAGAAVDGEGATYSIHGNVKIKNDVNLHNATFVQTMEPIDIGPYIPSAKGKGQMTVEPPAAFRKMVGTLPVMSAEGIATYSDDVVLSDEQASALAETIDVNTLDIRGTKEKPVSVRLEKIKVNRGNHPQIGDDNCAAVFMAFVSPVVIKNVEVTGNGKGCGISLRHSSKVQLQRVNIHDMVWEPSIGDPVFQVASAKSIKEEFGWNNFPIYQFRRGTKKFMRTRVREQIAGMLIMGGSDVQISDCKVERLQGRIGQRLYPLQADGISVTDITNLVVQNTQISKVWEGLDITGGLCDGILVRDCKASDILSYGFKLAHPKRNAKYIDCTTIRTGNSAFVMEPEMENIEFIRCKALETGASGYWLRDNGQHLTSIRGFAIETDKVRPNPLNVKFDHCSAINKKFPKTMDIGFLCEGDVNPEERQIRAVGCTVVGAVQKDFQGLVVQ